MASVRTRVSALLIASAAALLTGCVGEVAPQEPVAVLSPGAEVPVYKAPKSPTTTAPDAAPTGRGAVIVPVDVESCDQVWVAGKAFPTEYAGCFKSDGNTIVDASKRRCHVGLDPETHQTHNGRYWATLGGRVHEDPARAKKFAASVEGCGSALQ